MSSRRRSARRRRSGEEDADLLAANEEAEYVEHVRGKHRREEEEEEEEEDRRQLERQEEEEEEQQLSRLERQEKEEEEPESDIYDRRGEDARDVLLPEECWIATVRFRYLPRDSDLPPKLHGLATEWVRVDIKAATGAFIRDHPVRDVNFQQYQFKTDCKTSIHDLLGREWRNRAVDVHLEFGLTVVEQLGEGDRTVCDEVEGLPLRLGNFPYSFTTNQASSIAARAHDMEIGVLRHGDLRLDLADANVAYTLSLRISDSRLVFTLTRLTAVVGGSAEWNRDAPHPPVSRFMLTDACAYGYKIWGG